MAAPPERDIQMRPYADGDEAGILALFKAAFARDKDPEIWRWFYLRGPWGAGKMEVAVCGGRIIGFYGGLPGQLRVGGETLSALQSTDTMIHPDFRDLQTFLRLARRAYARFAAEGVQVVYGFPNEAIAKVRKVMLKWRLLDDVQALAHPTLGELPPTAPPKGVRLVPVERFDERADGLWTRALPAEAAARARGAAYLNWRFVDKPKLEQQRLAAEDASGKLLGVAVGKLFAGASPAADLLELIVDEEAAPGTAAALAGALLENLADAGARTASCWFPEGDARRAALERLGFAPSDFKTHFGYAFIDGSGRTLDRWHLTMGDSDVF